MQGSFHFARLDRYVTGCEVSGMVPLPPKTCRSKIGFPTLESLGVDVQVGTELGPDEPGFVIGVCTCRNDAGSPRFLRKGEVTEESILLIRCTLRQEFACGCTVLKWVRSAVSDKWSKREASWAIMLMMPGT